MTDLRLPAENRAILAGVNLARPIPLGPDPTALRRAAVDTLSRTVMAQATALFGEVRPDQVAGKLFQNDRDTGLLTRSAQLRRKEDGGGGWMIRGSVSPTTTTNRPVRLHGRGASVCFRPLRKRPLIASTVRDLAGIPSARIIDGRRVPLKASGRRIR